MNQCQVIIKMSFNIEDYQELQEDVFKRYQCNKPLVDKFTKKPLMKDGKSVFIRDMTLQEFTEKVQFDYNNISFTFTKQLCEPKWQECQMEKESEESTSKITEFMPKKLKRSPI